MNVFAQRAVIITLVLMVFISAVAVVNIKHINRLKFIEMHALIVEQGELRTEWARLQLGLYSFANYGRVEKVARQELDMYIPSLDQTVNIVIHE